MISFRGSYDYQKQSQRSQINHKLLNFNVKMLTDIFEMIQSNYSINQFALAIRQYVLKHDCLLLKQKLINFYLNCEKKLTNKSDQQWKTVINNQLNILRGINQLQKCITKITFQKGFSKIINRDYLPQFTQKIVQIKTIQNITDQQIDSIEVSEDVKIKTRYFFKWTQFVESANNLKRIRLKQIDDLRKSFTFNIYAVKFSCFVNWKKITKKTILNRQRFQKIQINKKARLFQNSINAFYTKFGMFQLIKEIMKIENLLTKKIENNLNSQKINMFFAKLRQNSLLQKRKQRSLLVENKWIYRFVSWITQQMVPLKSRTLIDNRNKSFKKYQLICQKQILTSLKQLIQKTKLKQNQTQLLIKKGFMQRFCLRIKDNQHFNKNIQEINTYVFNKKVFHTLNIFKINKKINLKELKSNQSIQNQQHRQFQSTNVLYIQKIIQLQKIREKNVNLQKVQANIKKGYFIKFVNGLKLIKDKRMEENSKIDIILKNQCQKFVIQLKKRQQKRNIIKSKQTQYLKCYQHKLIRKVFFNIKDWKNYQIGEEQNIKKLFSIFEKKKIQQSFTQIKTLSNLKGAIITIQTKIQKLLVKKVWDQCFKKQIQLIKSVNKKIQQKKINSQKKLFQILLKNVQNLHQGQQRIQFHICSNLKLKLLSCITENYSLAKKAQLLQNYRATVKVKFFLKQLLDKKMELQVLNCKFIMLQKFNSLRLLQKKIKQKREFDKEDQQKQNKIHINQLKTLFKNSIRNCKNDKIYRERQVNKVQILKNYVMKNTLRLIKDNLMNIQQKSQAILNKKYNKLQTYRKKEFLYQIILQKNMSKVRQSFQITQKRFFFSFMTTVRKDRQNRQKLQQMLAKLYKEHSLHLFFKVLNQQKQNIQNNSDKLVKLRAKNCLIKLSSNKSRTQIIHEIKKNYEKLCYKKTVKALSILMKNCLIKKFDKVKNMCSVKNYAKNIKKRAFKGLKKMLLKIRQKQNRLKTEEEQFKKVQRSYSKIKKQSTLTETIQKFNIRHSRQIR